jgi:CBS domain-containing protein
MHESVDPQEPMAIESLGGGEDEAGSGESLVDLFLRVNSLLPDDQDVVSVPPDASVAKALDIMRQNGFSQLPVMAGDSVIGVFSYRSLAQRVVEIGRPDVAQLEVDDCLEKLEFVRPSDEVEALFDHLDRDGAVLVGDPDRLLAVATSTDLIRYLYAVSHPFVLIQEIELVLRGLVRRAVSAEDLTSYIRRAISHLYKDRPDRLPSELTGLNFGELVQVVIHGLNYADAFVRVLGRNRDSTRGYLDPIPRLRNDVFHFKRQVSGEDMQMLANTRAWLLRKALVAEAGS